MAPVCFLIAGEQHWSCSAMMRGIYLDGYDIKVFNQNLYDEN